MSIGENIKEARKRAGMNQTQLASALNIAYNSVGQYERNLRVPRSDILLRMADILGTTPNKIMGIEEKEPPVAATTDDSVVRITESTPIIHQSESARNQKMDDLSKEGKILGILYSAMKLDDKSLDALYRLAMILSYENDGGKI